MGLSENPKWNGARNILYVAPTVTPQTCQLETELNDLGWKVSLGNKLTDVRLHLQEEKIGVGVLCVDDPEFAEDVLAIAGSVYWVAVVSDEILVNEDAQRLLSRHFYDYHTIPVDARRLAETLGHALGIVHLRRLHGDNDVDHNSVHGLIGECPAMRDIKRTISRVAKKDFPVLISGQSGTGKELIARAVHDQSHRCDGPFVAVNCGALAPTLIESELFGHEKGSFTGADKHRVGRFEAASGGTLFLDEIGELSLDLQVKLLRVLERGAIERVGNNQSRSVDVRVVTATNVNLRQAVSDKRFREDLYYRINVFQIEVPPLSERGDDILLLAESYLAEFNNEERPKTFSKRALNAMRAHTWRGNVRELINRIQRALVSCESRLILPNHLGLKSIPGNGAKPGPTLEEARNEIEKIVLTDALSRNANNISQVARELAVSRVTVYHLLKKHSLHAFVDTSGIATMVDDDARTSDKRLA